MSILCTVGIVVAMIAYSAVLFYLIVLVGRLVRAVESIDRKFESASKI